MRSVEKSVRQGGSTTIEAPLLVSVPEAARLLSVGTTFAWEMVHNGELPTVKLGRRVLVPRAAIEEIARIGHLDKSRHGDSDDAGDVHELVPIAQLPRTPRA